ncbi:hypothetical protein [Geopseudomonas aromaticivorans]
MNSASPKSPQASRRARILSGARERLIKAQVLARDSQAAAAEARSFACYRRQGLWKQVQARAKAILRCAESNGLAPERPYLVRDGAAWIIGFRGDHLIRVYEPSELRLDPRRLP